MNRMILRFTFWLAVLAAWGVENIKAADLVAKLPEIQIDGQVYRRVTLTKRSDSEAVMQFDGGVRKVNLADLPEPLRSQWYDEKLVESQKAEEEQRRVAEAARLSVRPQTEAPAQNGGQIGGAAFYSPSQRAEFDRSVEEASHAKLIRQDYQASPPAGAARSGGFSVEGLIILLAWTLVGLVVYFIPAIVAVNRGHKNLPALFALNLLVGWTILGWVGALVWALLREQAPSAGLSA